MTSEMRARHGTAHGTTTLRRRHQGKQVSRQNAAFACRSLLSKQQEKELVSYINKLGFTITADVALGATGQRNHD